MRVLVIYDISDDDSRTKLADDLKRLGLTRIQRSAFIGNITAATVKEISRVCSHRARGEDDIVHIVPLCDYDWRKSIVIGKPMNEYGGDVQVV
ncbi:MAG: CRISPR-associated endonuclease Cas2 [Sulfolobales archaeon]|nr:CRISPR-associated endonuclease Cas2 [Sulfolobales archaeon]MDW7970160.1 CRISPR-associated endonuclease Cas2 [Sulfolobales archaeon]